MRKQSIMLFLALFVMLSNSYADSIKEDYELQERCGKSSAEFFKKMYGSGNDIKNLIHSYVSHYNKKLDKCFIEIISIGEGEGGKQGSLTMQLYDVHEDKIYAIFYRTSEKMDCSLYVPQVMKCHSQEQWNQLVKPFMEK